MLSAKRRVFSVTAVGKMCE